MSTQNSLASTCKNISTANMVLSRTVVYATVQVKDNLNLMIAAQVLMDIGVDELHIFQS